MRNWHTRLQYAQISGNHGEAKYYFGQILILMAYIKTLEAQSKTMRITTFQK